MYRTGQNGTPIDDLTYQYFGASNRLMVVQDNPITNSPGFETSRMPQDYFYDTYGNLTRDLNKGIGTSTTDGYRYNHLNQPIRLVKGTSNMQLFYNAAGQKVRKVVLQNGVTTTTDYLDGFQYKNTTLEFFGHAEGFVANNSGTLRYVFQYKDQVGNVRVSYAANQAGQATILEENHYYPYGLKHAGYGMTTTDQNAAYKYRYNSREYHDELDLDMTAMDFRLYDNILGRFFGMDALSENYHYISPYHFSNCNPVMFADPTGLMPEWWPDWMRDIWQGSGDSATWTNTGGGLTNNDTGQFVSIDAGPSGGGGGGFNDFSGFSFVNYNPGESINFLLVFPSNYADDNILLADFTVAKAKGMTIMLVDHIGGFLRGLEQLSLDDSNIDTVVFNSHGSDGFFYIGSTKISLDALGADGNFSVLTGIDDKLKNKNIVVLACNAGSEDKGFRFTREFSRQTQATVITSQHTCLAGYLYNGNSTQLMSFHPDERKTGDMWRISTKGSDPVNIYSLSMDKSNNTTTYHFTRQHYTWWFIN